METFLKLCCIWQVGNEVDKDDCDDEYISCDNNEREHTVTNQIIIYDDYIQSV